MKSRVSQRDIFLFVQQSISCPDKNVDATEGIVSLSAPHVLQMKNRRKLIFNPIKNAPALCRDNPISFMSLGGRKGGSLGDEGLLGGGRGGSSEGRRGRHQLGLQQCWRHYRRAPIAATTKVGVLSDHQAARWGDRDARSYQMSTLSVFLHERRGFEVVTTLVSFENG